MRQSNLFAKTRKTVAKGVEAVSHKYLLRGDFIEQLSSGIYTLLPLGLRVHKKIEDIIKEEMFLIGAQELLMPSLQPSTLWKESGRLKIMDPPLFVTEDVHGKELVLASTHEEVITSLVSGRILSYKDLPQSLFQIQTKFRNEMRATGGLLRVREFVMKDLYSFHKNKKELDIYYAKVQKSYLNIFKKCGIKVVPVEADSGSIGGNASHEFACLAETGEDTVLICDTCKWAGNLEVVKSKTASKCPRGHSTIQRQKAIENGHIFKLGTEYSDKLKAYFTDKQGKRHPLVMGCYGIGIGRLLATVVETSHDERGIIWPVSIAPFQVHLITLGEKMQVLRQSENTYKDLVKDGFDVLWDDRKESAGIKLADSDLMGIPVRIIVSAKNTKKIEYKRRDSSKIGILSAKMLTAKLSQVYGAS